MARPSCLKSARWSSGITACALPQPGFLHFRGQGGGDFHAAILEVQNNHGGIELNDKVRKMLGSVQQENVNSHALGIIVKDRKTGSFINHVMISKNSRLPAEVRQTFVTNRYGQERVTVRVVQGDAPDRAACAIVGECRITDLPPNLPRVPPLKSPTHSIFPAVFACARRTRRAERRPSPRSTPRRP